MHQKVATPRFARDPGADGDGFHWDFSRVYVRLYSTRRPHKQGRSEAMMYRLVGALGVLIVTASIACSSDSALGPRCGFGNPCAQGPISSLQFIPGKDSLLVGDRAQIVVRALDSTGTPITDVTYQYSSSNTRVATVDATGIVTALDTGVTILTLSAGDKQAHDSLFVFSAAMLAIDGGAETTCALQNLGRTLCWGENSRGQLGFTQDTVCFGEFPQDTLACSIYPQHVTQSTGFASVSAGDSLTCAVVTDGSAACWGAGQVGQLGNGTKTTNATPIPSRVFGAASFASITVGGEHACGLSGSGIAYCWGLDSFGQLGDARLVNSTTPIPVVTSAQTPMQFASLSAGYMHTCGLTPAGAAFCWGDNSRGQLGTGGASTDLPAPVAGGLTFTAISSGIDTSRSAASQTAGALRSSFTCGLSGGAAYCWGAGIGAPGTPTLVGGGLSFTQISAGGAHACALTQDGTAYCWGYDGDDQLGNGPGPSSSVTPVAVGGGLRFTNIAAGRRHTCGTATDGLAYCWGSDVYGALGNTYQAAFRGLPQPVGQPVLTLPPSASRADLRSVHALLRQ
jgi:alpha-tubulin suppressor-like RCC1 family protein